jgi:hypothetical protein
MSRTPSPSPTGRLPAAEENTAMNLDDTTSQHSVTERQLRRLVVPAPTEYGATKRLDVIQEPDLDLLWGGPE